MRQKLTNRLFFIFSLVKNIIFLFYLKIKLFHQHRKILIINLDEHLGDLIACEPISRFARKKYSSDYIIWITNYKYIDVVKYNNYLSNTLGVYCLYEWILLKQIFHDEKVIDLHIDNRKCTVFNKYLSNPNNCGITLDNYFNFGSILESFGLAAGLERITDSPFFHFKPNLLIHYEFPKGAIVVHCKSNEICKDWNDAKWNYLCEKLIDDGHTIMEFGFTNSISLINDNYFNFCDKRSIQEIAYLIKISKLFIGIDSSFAHLANALTIPGILLMGKYRIFDSYTPYTGFYTNLKQNRIIHHVGLAEEIQVETVYKLATELLMESKHRIEV